MLFQGSESGESQVALPNRLEVLEGPDTNHDGASESQLDLSNKVLGVMNNSSTISHMELNKVTTVDKLIIDKFKNIFSFQPDTTISSMAGQTGETLVKIFDRIGTLSDSKAGIMQLYSFMQANPSVDLEPFLTQKSKAFRSYIDRGLRRIETNSGDQLPPAVTGGADTEAGRAGGADTNSGEPMGGEYGSPTVQGTETRESQVDLSNKGQRLLDNSITIKQEDFSDSQVGLYSLAVSG